VRRACAARLFRSPLSELVVSDDPPRAAYDSNSSSSSSSSSNGSNGVSDREMRTSRSREPRERERERRGVGQPLRRTPWRGVGQTARARGRGGSGGHGGGWERGGDSSLHVTHLNMYRDNARVERTYGARRVLEWNGASRSVSDSLFTSRVSLSLARSPLSPAPPLLTPSPSPSQSQASPRVGPESRARSFRTIDVRSDICPSCQYRGRKIPKGLIFRADRVRSCKNYVHSRGRGNVRRIDDLIITFILRILSTTRASCIFDLLRDRIAIVLHARSDVPKLRAPRSRDPSKEDTLSAARWHFQSAICDCKAGGERDNDNRYREACVCTRALGSESRRIAYAMPGGARIC